MRVGFFDGHLESIRRMSSSAREIDSLKAVSRAGDGLPSNAANFRQAKIAAMTPTVLLRPSSMEAEKCA
jgi:hypothetical protein